MIPNPGTTLVNFHIVVLHEATDLLHQVMCIMPYCPGGMVTKIAVDMATFFLHHRLSPYGHGQMPNFWHLRPLKKLGLQD